MPPPQALDVRNLPQLDARDGVYGLRASGRKFVDHPKLLFDRSFLDCRLSTQRWTT
jgi:hypothetical protein